MNKAVLAGLAVALLSSAAQARDVASGTLMVTGDSSILNSSSKTDSSEPAIRGTEDNTDINLIGFYFPVDNFGAGLVLTRSDTKTSTTYVEKTSVTMVGPGAGYNISLGQDLGFMLHAEYLLADGTMDNLGGSGINADIKGHGYMYGGVLHYFVNDNVALNLSLLRNRVSFDYEYSNNIVPNLSAKIGQTTTQAGISVFF